MIIESTRSEELFEKFCNQCSFKFDRLLPSYQRGVRSPDYDIFPHEKRVVVEVKELVPGPFDEAARASEARNRYCFCDQRGRVRDTVGKACGQLKTRSQGTVPAVLVLFDCGIIGGIDCIDIKNAMYGDETLEVLSDPNAGEEFNVGYMRGGSKCTETSNRSLSAVAVLAFRDQLLSLAVFHNIYATCPLPIDWMRNSNCHQYSINRDSGSTIPDWHLVS